MSRRRHQDCSCQKNSDLTEIELSDRGLMVAQVPALPNLGLSETLATKLALDALDNFEPPSLAVPACRSHGPNLRFIPYKLFAPLDNCLFRGVLKDQVCLGWKRLSSESHGMTSPPGGFDTRITICLNKSIRKLPRQIATPVTLAALIHHMAHAYFMVCCGTGDGSSRTDKHSPCHGLAYSTLVHKIKEVFRAPEVKKLPSLFTCLPINPLPLPSGKQLRKPDQGSCSKDAHNFLDKETCHAHALTLQELKPEEKKNDGSYPKSHYLHTADVKKSKFDPVLRTQYPSPPSEFVEFHYDSYAVPFPRSKLKKYSSLIANLQDGNILSIPAKSKTVFFAFYSYIKSGDYPPELVTITTPYFTAAKADGPPSISTYLPDAENYLALDVQMFNLASTLKFPELRDKALERMRSMSETHADPIAVLEEIYGKNIKNEEDKNQLRAWARDFLLKLHQGSDLINLQILEQSEQWGERFSKLAGQDSLFRSDCDVVIKDWITNRALLFIGATKKESSKDEDGASVKKFLSNSDLEFLQQHNPAISVLYQEEKRKRDKEKKTDVKKQKDVEGISNEKKTGDDEHTHTTIPCQCQACFQRAAEHYGWHNAASAAHHFFSRPIPPVAYPPIPQPTYTAQGDFPYYFPFS